MGAGAGRGAGTGCALIELYTGDFLSQAQLQQVLMQQRMAVRGTPCRRGGTS